MTAQTKFIPLEDVGQIAWARLSHAANDVNDPMRLITMANLDLAGRPTARLMVIRGADAKTGRLWVHTDRQSAKVSQLRHRPHLCAVAYDPVELIQVRLFGSATLHERDAIADDHWHQLMLSMRHAYGLPSAPAQQVPASDPRLSRIWVHQRSKKIAEDRSRFVVLQFTVATLEWLQTRGAEQRRAVLCATNNWASSECESCAVTLERTHP